MPKPVKPIPSEYHSVTVGLVVQNAAKAIEFYQKALGAKELVRMLGPDGKSITHAEIRIGDTTIFVGDEVPNMSAKSPVSLGGASSTLHLYVENTDAAFQQAVAAGAKPRSPPMDMFWGDRYAQVIDPFGHVWGIATHIEDVPPAEMGKRAAAFYQKMASQPHPSV